jgi:hypothetical protein
MRELNDYEIDAVSGGEIKGCRPAGSTLGDYINLAIGVIAYRIGELFSPPRDPWA